MKKSDYFVVYTYHRDPESKEKTDGRVIGVYYTEAAANRAYDQIFNLYSEDEYTYDSMMLFEVGIMDSNFELMEDFYRMIDTGHTKLLLKVLDLLADQGRIELLQNCYV